MKKNKYKIPLEGKALLALTSTEELEDGYSISELRDAGYPDLAVRGAGYSASEGREIENLINKIPKLKNPYSHLWKDIQDKKRLHNQSLWGPEKPCDNLCGTPMCTAGHLVNMAGKAGYELRKITSWQFAAGIIHEKAHPDVPAQNFGNIHQEYALEYIKQMAVYEEGIK